MDILEIFSKSLSLHVYVEFSATSNFPFNAQPLRGEIFLTSTKIIEQSKIKTNFQAETRIQILEKSVSEAQFSESQVSELQQWIFRVDDLLNDYIEHDTTFECLPHDFQVIFLFECFNHFGTQEDFTNNTNMAHKID